MLIQGQSSTSYHIFDVIQNSCNHDATFGTNITLDFMSTLVLPFVSKHV